MDEDFEKGKQYLIEGLESLLAFYEPVLKVVYGIRLLGSADALLSNPEVSAAFDSFEQLILVIKSWLTDIRQAADKQELIQSVEKSGEFMMRFLGHG